MDTLIALSLLIVVIFQVVDRKPWVRDRRKKFYRALIKQWEMKFWEDDATRHFLDHHEIPRFKNLIEYHTQKKNQLEQKMKASGKNDEQTKIQIQRFSDNIEAYKEAMNADIMMSNRLKNAHTLLAKKVEFIKRKILTNAIPVEHYSLEEERKEEHE